MADNNNLMQALNGAMVQRVAIGVITLLLAVAGFLAKLEYTNIDERIDSNSAAVTRALTEMRSVDDKLTGVRDEQMRRKGVLDKHDADIKWLWQEADKVKADNRYLYDLTLKGISRGERLDERLQRLEQALTQIEQRISPYGDQQQQQQRKR